jgi:hypothetical protein
MLPGTGLCFGLSPEHMTYSIDDAFRQKNLQILAKVSAIGLFWFSVNMRGSARRRGFRPSGGDFQGMGIYRSNADLGQNRLQDGRVYISAIAGKHHVEMLGEPAIRLHTGWFGHDYILRRDLGGSKSRSSMRDSGRIVATRKAAQIENGKRPCGADAPTESS